MSANRIWLLVPNLITAWVKAAAESTPPASWITPEPAKKTAILRPEAVTQFRTSTNAARTTVIILINASAGQTFIPARPHCRASAPPAVVNMPTVNARALINPVIVVKLPVPLPAPGAERQNTHPVKNAVQTPARPAQNQSPATLDREKSKSRQPNAARLAIAANHRHLNHLLPAVGIAHLLRLHPEVIAVLHLPARLQAPAAPEAIIQIAR